MSRRPFLPPTYFLLGLIVMAGLHLLAPVSQLIAWPWRLLGGLPILVGGALNVRCSSLFERRGTSVKPFEESRALIVEGPFHYSRNPMYLGLVLILVGIAVLLGSLTPFLVPPVFLWLISVRFVVPEEQALAERFGPEYLEYKKKVRRWV